MEQQLFTTTNAPANLSINWSTGDIGVSSLQNLSPGSYDVTVSDNNNCSIVEPFIITEPDSLYTQLYTQGVN